MMMADYPSYHMGKFVDIPYSWTQCRLWDNWLLLTLTMSEFLHIEKEEWCTTRNLAHECNSICIVFGLDTSPVSNRIDERRQRWNVWRSTNNMTSNRHYPHLPEVSISFYSHYRSFPLSINHPWLGTYPSPWQGKAPSYPAVTKSSLLTTTTQLPTIPSFLQHPPEYD